jgi:hypothetical protein
MYKSALRIYVQVYRYNCIMYNLERGGVVKSTIIWQTIFVEACGNLYLKMNRLPFYYL